MNDMRKKLVWILSALLTLLFLFIAITRLEWRSFISLIKGFEVKYLIGATIVYFFSYVIRALRIRFLIRSSSISFRKILSISLLHNFFNRILPARTGELSLLYLLYKYSEVPIRDSSPILIILRIYDLIASLMLISIAGLALYSKVFSFVSIFIFLSLLILIAFFPVTILSCFNKLLLRMNFNNKYTSKLFDLFKYYINHMTYLQSWGVRFFLLITSLLIWILIILFFIFLMLGLDFYKNFWDTVFATSIANFSWILPINGIGGFGTMELGWVAAFGILNYSIDEVLKVAIFVNICAFLCTIIFTTYPIIILGFGRKKGIEFH